MKEDRSGDGKSGYKALAEVFHASDDNMPDWYENSGDGEKWTDLR